MAQQKDRASSHRRLLSSSRGPGDGESAKVVLKMLARRLKEVAGYQISSASLAAGLKTLSVWHRCINSGDDTFVTLCARYPHLVESPPTNPAGQLYAAYLRELLATFAVCKHAYHRETTFDEPRMRRISEEMVVEESQLIECQLRRLVACDMQGGLIDHKTRNSTQYCINLLILDAIGLFKALDGAVERLREMVSSLAKSDADKMVRLFGNYEKLVDKLTALAGQADFRPDVTVPLTAFDEASVEDFKRKIASAKARLQTDKDSFAAFKTAAGLARADTASGGTRAATITMEEVEASQIPRNPPPIPPKPGAITMMESSSTVAGADLIDLSEDMVGGIIVGATAPATTGADSWDLLSSGAPLGAQGNAHGGFDLLSEPSATPLTGGSKVSLNDATLSMLYSQSAVGGTLGGIGGLGMTAGVGGMDTVGMGPMGAFGTGVNSTLATQSLAHVSGPPKPAGAPPLPSSATGGLISRGGGMVPTSGFGPDGAPVGGVRLPGLGEGLPAGGARYRDSLGALGQVDAHEANPFA